MVRGGGDPAKGGREERKRIACLEDLYNSVYLIFSGDGISLKFSSVGRTCSVPLEEHDLKRRVMDYERMLWDG